MRNAKTRFKRLLRTRNSEFFQVELADDNRIAFLLYVDRQNVEESIDIYLISHFQVSAESYEEVLSFNNDMLGMKPVRHYFMGNLVLVDHELNFDFPKDMTAICDFVNQVLGDKSDALKLNSIQTNDFNYLSQD